MLYYHWIPVIDLIWYPACYPFCHGWVVCSLSYLPGFFYSFSNSVVYVREWRVQLFVPITVLIPIMGWKWEQKKTNALFAVVVFSWHIAYFLNHFLVYIVPWKTKHYWFKAVTAVHHYCSHGITISLPYPWHYPIIFPSLVIHSGYCHITEFSITMSFSSVCVCTSVFPCSVGKHSAA